MNKQAPTPADMLTIDFADHTLEVDTRGFLSEMQKRETSLNPSDESSGYEDPRSESLTETQVNWLLNQLK